MGRFQAQAAYPCGDCGVFVLEEAVQVADGDVVRSRDGGWGEMRVVQVLSNERLDAQDEGPTVRLRREAPARFEHVGDKSGDQIRQDRAQPGPVGRLERGRVCGQLGEKLHELPPSPGRRCCGARTAARKR